MRHAYMIMIHNCSEQVKTLVSLLDHPSNAIYIHIDRKARNAGNFMRELDAVLKWSPVCFTDRVNVSWGGYSQIEAEYVLLRAAVSGEYDYYHLLSGADLPIRSQKEIHEFFECQNGKNFVEFGKQEYIDSIGYRYKYYWLFQNRVGKNKTIPARFLNKIQMMAVALQKKVRFDRTANTDVRFSAGPNWFSISHELANYVVEQEHQVKKLFRYGFCADEVFLQTLVVNSPYLQSCYYEDGTPCGCLRMVLWKNGKPQVYRKEDFPLLCSGENKLFARKFDSRTDPDIIRKIVAYTQPAEE